MDRTPPIPAAPGLGIPGRAGRHVAVEGVVGTDYAERPDEDPTERRAIERRIGDAACHTTRTLLPGTALAVLALGAVLLSYDAFVCSHTVLLPWLLWASLAGAGVLLMHVWARKSARPWHPIVAGNLVALFLMAAAWLPCEQARPASAAAIMVVAVAGATLLAVLPAAVAGLVLVPLGAGLAAALTGAGGDWVVAGSIGSLAACAAGTVRYGQWRRDMRALIDGLDKLREVEHERNKAWRTDHEKSRFLAIASHDLRQPVHALGLFAATLQRRLAQSPDEPLARNLMRAVDGLERSFNAVLDISKLDAGALVPRMETFSLRDMFRRLHMQYAGQAEFAGLGLRFSPGGKSVTSDPQLLERIVGNLIQNAIKYTARGGIVVVARSTRHCINVEVWDTGSGIAPAELPRIFDEFYQVGRGERDRSHGLGMGLAIVKRLAALLGHRLEVMSVLGRGTGFRIGVPIGGLPGIQEDLAPADTQPMLASTPQMVLVVDDKEPIREGLGLLLHEWGYEAMTASDAAQAEQVVTGLEGRVDLILSDLHLGDGPDGVEVIANVRRLCGRDVPAILITGDTAPEQVRRVTDGSDAVLFKPVQPRRLFEALRAALG
jgi:two-component system, sensor histidine kinase